MHRQTHEVLRTVFLVECEQLVGVEIGGLPPVDDVLEADDGGMPVFLQMQVIVPITLFIHQVGIPVSMFGFALRAPVCPNAELRVPKPFGKLVTGQRTPLRFERPVGDGKRGLGILSMGEASQTEQKGDCNE